MSGDEYMYRTGRTPVERGAGAMASEIARWALAHALRTGQVVPRDLERAFPFTVPGRLAVLLRQMAQRGVLTRLSPTEPRHTPSVFGPGDLSDLRTLHAELTALLALSPTPEVPSETHP